MITKREFAQRRARVMKAIGKNAVAIVATASEKIRSRDTEYVFRPDSDFFYLSGFSEPEAVLVLLPGRRHGDYVMFCRERDMEKEIWNGRRAGLEGVKKNFSVREAYPIHKIDEILPGLLENRERVYYHVGSDAAFDERLMGWVKQVRRKARTGIRAPQEFLGIDRIVHEMRLIKSPAEIKAMRYAAEVSALAHCNAMRTCRPGMREYAVEAEIIHTFRKHNCTTAYNSIVGGGENACILHYIENNAVLHNNQLLLIDAGAEYLNYAADITRTFPVNGKYTPEQRALYELVLKAQRAAIRQIKPGNRWHQPHDAAVKVLTQGLVDLGLLHGNARELIKNEAYRRFYMHRTGHWLGMDVHDVGDYKIKGKWRTFKPGMVLTVEPGLYIAAKSKGVSKEWWNIGIRIEDDVLVTRNGHDILTDAVPKDPDEIEALMANGKN